MSNGASRDAFAASAIGFASTRKTAHQGISDVIKNVKRVLGNFDSAVSPTLTCRWRGRKAVCLGLESNATANLRSSLRFS